MIHAIEGDRSHARTNINFFFIIEPISAYISYTVHRVTQDTIHVNL
ncbi:hypothetical protein [Anabaena sp. CCY 9910]